MAFSLLPDALYQNNKVVSTLIDKNLLNSRYLGSLSPHRDVPVPSLQSHVPDIPCISFFRTKMSCCIICKTSCCFQQFVFSGSFIICNGSLDQMTHTIQFMMILQICENLIFSVDNIISIQISVILLSCTHDIDGSVCDCLQFRIRMLGQRITDCFDPFGKNLNPGIQNHKTYLPDDWDLPVMIQIHGMYIWVL